MNMHNQKNWFWFFTFFLMFFCASSSIYALNVKSTKKEYEKKYFGNAIFSFSFKMDELKGGKKAENIVKKLIYHNKSASDYIKYKEKLFLGGVKPEDFPKELNKDGSPMEYRSSYIEEIKAVCFNKDFVIFEYKDYFYISRAAHGMYQIKYYIIDLNESRILRIDDLIENIPEDAVKKALLSKYDNLTFSFRKTALPPDAVSFTKDGFLMLWNVYSIAPYSYGPIEIVLPYDSVDFYLTNLGGAVKKMVVN
ncbi:MAG: RsiV family protein [Spirochaetaceae bacterium]|jgi:hypothetical protein|nr:RsiV family protein [Spirochaetaceae bacterium]